MPSLRVKYALAHLSHEEHIARLARPNWRRLRRIDPNLLVAPYDVARPALKGYATRRIRIMAQPKYLTKKYDPVTVLLDNLKWVPSMSMRETMSDLLAKVRKSRYRRYRIFCNARQEREARKRRRELAKLRAALKGPEDWRRHMKILEKLAAPKPIARPIRKKPIKKWRPVDMGRIESLSLPTVRDVLEPRDFKVSPEALTYKITKRMEKLAERRDIPVIEPRIIAVSPSALKAVATERTIILAKPIQRPAGMETDLREDAFIVSPMALKARCSRRLKNLAKPKVYPKPKFKRLRTALRK